MVFLRQIAGISIGPSCGGLLGGPKAAAQKEKRQKALCTRKYFGRYSWGGGSIAPYLGYKGRRTSHMLMRWKMGKGSSLVRVG